jgi:hypothetical protein
LGSITRTSWPSRCSRSCPAVTTGSPNASPDSTSARASRRIPISTLVRTALPPSIFQTNDSVPWAMIASSGIVSASGFSRSTTRARANMPVRNAPSGLASVPRASSERPLASIWASIARSVAVNVLPGIESTDSCTGMPGRIRPK